MIRSMKPWIVTLPFLLALLPSALGQDSSEEPKIPVQDLVAGGHAKQRYFLIGDSASKSTKKLGLVLVLPGGDGSASFHPFVRNMWKHALGEKFLVVQLVSVKWTEDQEIIWPLKNSNVKKAEFTTEEFATAVLADLKKRKIAFDHTKVFTLSWSSGGPAAYKMALDLPEIRGSFVAMSVFKEKDLAPLSRAKGHAFYIFHSKQDDRCPWSLAEAAAVKLKEQGAKTTLVPYEGDHGWPKTVYPDLKSGFEWLEKNSTPKR